MRVSVGIAELAHTCPGAEPEQVGARRAGEIDSGKGVLRDRGPRRGHAESRQDHRCQRENAMAGFSVRWNSPFAIDIDRCRGFECSRDADAAMICC